jgi:hypothetical protein
MSNQAHARVVAFHLRQHDIVGAELGADPFQIPEGSGLLECRRVADDAERGDSLGRRQPSYSRIRDAPRDPVELFHAGFVVEGHDGDSDPRVLRSRPPGTRDQRSGDERQPDKGGEAPAADRSSTLLA